MQFRLVNNLTRRSIIVSSWAEVEHYIKEVSLAFGKACILHVASVRYGYIVGQDGSIIVDTTVLPASLTHNNEEAN